MFSPRVIVKTKAHVVQNKRASLEREMTRSPRGSEVREDRAEELLKAILDCVHSDLLCVRKGLYEVGRRFSTKSTVRERVDVDGDLDDDDDDSDSSDDDDIQ